MLPQALPQIPRLSDLNTLFSNIVVIALEFFGVVFFVMFMVGSLKYITSGSDQNKVQAARKTLGAAVGGLVFVILSLLILQLIENFTGANVTDFSINI